MWAIKCKYKDKIWIFSTHTSQKVANRQLKKYQKKHDFFKDFWVEEYTPPPKEQLLKALNIHRGCLVCNSVRLRIIEDGARNVMDTHTGEEGMKLKIGESIIISQLPKEEEKEYFVPHKLLEQYVLLVKMMMHARGLSIHFYKQIEQEREKVHNEILKGVGVDRNDKDFQFWLSQTTERMLDKACR